MTSDTLLYPFSVATVTWYRKIHAETVFDSIYSSQGNHVCYYLNKKTIKKSLSTSKATEGLNLEISQNTYCLVITKN